MNIRFVYKTGQELEIKDVLRCTFVGKTGKVFTLEPDSEDKRIPGICRMAAIHITQDGGGLVSIAAKGLRAVFLGGISQKKMED